MSAYEELATVVEMLHAGAVGYLVKGTPPGEVIDAIARAARGQASLSVDMLFRVIDRLAGRGRDHRRQTRPAGATARDAGADETS